MFNFHSELQQIRMKKQETQRSGVARCQKCFKYGHYTYECQNEATYRYRPSRTIQYKQKLKLLIKASSKPPKINVVNPDYKRRVRDEGPSSDSDQPQQQIQSEVKLQKQPVQNIEQKNQKKVVPLQSNPPREEQISSSSSSSPSSSSSSSSESSSEEEDSGPRKRRS